MISSLDLSDMAAHFDDDLRLSESIGCKGSDGSIAGHAHELYVTVDDRMPELTGASPGTSAGSASSSSGDVASSSKDRSQRGVSDSSGYGSGSSAESAAESAAEEDDSNYGFFEEIDAVDDGMLSPLPAALVASTGGVPSPSSREALYEEQQASHPGRHKSAPFGRTDSHSDHVHWLIRKETAAHHRCPNCHRFASLHAKNNSPRIFARSFMDSDGQTAMGLGGFRVVEGMWGKHIEFEVIVSTRRNTYHAWRSHADFERLARRQRVNAHANQSTEHGKVAKQWERLQSSLRWIWNVNDLNYLVERFTLLTAFVEELFFSMEKAQCMLDFADNTSWSGPDAKPPCRCGCS
mmetsp:Transcript_7078/g.17875  ORF Transcript_7078/g.17875 Transcript_7078/m.17875 type:complete len:350 (+) Transcript_7078:180-1229(+)